MKRMVGVMLCAAVLAGCGGLKSSQPAEQVYVLHAAPANVAAPGAAASQPVGGVLRIPRPDAQPGLDTSRIALTRAGNELDYFADSRWGESLPKVLAAFAVESIAHSGHFETVVDTAATPVMGDFDLLLTARHFEAAYAGETVGAVPTARVAFDCVLLGGAPRRVLGRCDAEAEEPATDNRLGAIVGALQRAAQKAMGDAGARAAALARAVRK
jgi:cholesterol transport system auxiliary component